MACAIPLDAGRAAFVDQLDLLVDEVGQLDDRQLLRPSRCLGWTALDLLVHVHLGLQEMITGLLSPTELSADTDAASYWLAEAPAQGRAAAPDPLDDIRFARVVASAYRRPTSFRRHLSITVPALRRAAVSDQAPATLEFQGHRLRLGDFLASWAVELVVHQLDLDAVISAPPADSALQITRRTFEALAGTTFPSGWSDLRVALVGSGREPAPGDADPTLRAALPLLA